MILKPHSTDLPEKPGIESNYGKLMERLGKLGLTTKSAGQTEFKPLSDSLKRESSKDDLEKLTERIKSLKN
jgi:hypothetical protein